MIEFRPHDGFEKEIAALEKRLPTMLGLETRWRKGVEMNNQVS